MGTELLLTAMLFQLFDRSLESNQGHSQRLFGLHKAENRLLLQQADFLAR